MRLRYLLLASAVLAALVPAAPARAAASCFGSQPTITGTKGEDRLVGTRGRDVIVGLGGDDQIEGRGGNDVICGYGGQDRIEGGPGRDRLNSGTTGVDFRSEWMYGGRGNDVLMGLAERIDGQIMYGGPGSDLLDAGDGDDIYIDELYGGPGNDRLRQGSGPAFLSGDDGDDDIDAGEGGDTVSFASSTAGVTVDLSLGTAEGQGTDRFEGIVDAYGSPFDDVIRGSAERNALLGLAGNDLLEGGDGNDCLSGGHPYCPPSGGSIPASGNDTLRGGNGDDSLYGLDGDDAYEGGEGSDAISFVIATQAVEVDLASGTATGEGSDSITGVEDVYGSRHADHILGDDGDNELSAHFASQGDVIEGRGGNDLVAGGPRADLLRGGDGDDDVRGFSGDDELHGDAGTDVLDGGTGTDRCFTGETYTGCEGGDVPEVNRTVTLRADSFPLQRYGQIFTLSVLVENHDPNLPEACEREVEVTITRRVATGDEEHVRTVTTRDDPDVPQSVGVEADLNATYRAAIGQMGECDADVSEEVELKVQKSVRLTPREQEVTRGERATLRAVVAPCRLRSADYSNEIVILQRKQGPDWVEVARKISSEECVATFRPRVSNKTTFRAVAPKTSELHEEGDSPWTTVTLR